MDNNIEELNFPPSFPIPRSNDDSGSIILNNDIQEVTQSLTHPLTHPLTHSLTYLLTYSGTTRFSATKT